MAKDKMGHGSEKRGVSAVQARNDRMHAMFDRARAQGHTTFNAEHDAAAATELARGNPKSGAVPVHAGASGVTEHLGNGVSRTTDAKGRMSYFDTPKNIGGTSTSRTGQDLRARRRSASLARAVK